MCRHTLGFLGSIPTSGGYGDTVTAQSNYLSETNFAASMTECYIHKPCTRTASKVLTLEDGKFIAAASMVSGGNSQRHIEALLGPEDRVHVGLGDLYIVDT